jgi:ribosomal protein S18 acetylase RimI-like enzyme
MIRYALFNDAKAIARVHISSWQQTYSQLMPTEYLTSLASTLPQREAFWVRTIEAGEPAVLVADVNDQVVGWISVGATRDNDITANDVGEVMAIYVLTEHWRAGIGRALWRAGLQYLLGGGFRRLTLWVLTENERAVQFYRRMGCVEDTESKRTIAIGGVTLEEVRYGCPMRFK